MKKPHHGRSSKLLVPTLARSQPAGILKDENGHWHLRGETSQTLDATFASVMRRIVAAKAFKLVAERETGYRQVKRQLEAIFAGRELQGRITKLARRVNNSCWVYKNFNKISQNVQSCPLLDIRRLSLKDLYLAKSIHWCLARQELTRKRLRRPADLGFHVYVTY